MMTVKESLMKTSIAALGITIIAITLSGCAKRIQKRVMILESISAEVQSHEKYALPRCKAITIPETKLQELLRKDVKVITSSPWNQAITYSFTTPRYMKPGTRTHRHGGTCYGTSYILEGPEKELQLGPRDAF